MKFLLLFGPPAVGKMTVGRALTNITGLKLFHNHLTIELVLPFFDFGTPAHKRLVGLFRRSIFKEVAQSDLKGLIFTFVWALDLKSDGKYVDKIIKLFEDAGAEIYYVELEASLEERLKRNKAPDRLEHKPSKRDVAHSEKMLLEHEKSYRFNSTADEFRRKNYLKINNTLLSARDAAEMIKNKFNL